MTSLFTNAIVKTIGGHMSLDKDHREFFAHVRKEVKIVVEGERDEIQRFVDEIQTSVSGRIKSIDRFDSEPSGDFDGFAIKR